MTATEELRRLLDERGVEWDKGEFPNEARTYWRDFFARPWDKQRLYVAALLTPEQAVAATLGPGTCRIELPGADYQCNGCGEIVGSTDPTSELYIDGNAIELWNYCPNCGRKVEK